MVYDLSKISGIGEFETKKEKERELFLINDKVFLVVNKNTIELRCDGKLSKLLCEKYESIMMSRYFGRGGIEMVMSGQLEENEVDDLVRLSYNLTRDVIISS